MRGCKFEEPTELKAVMKPKLAVASSDGHGLRCSVANEVTGRAGTVGTGR
jgi:hypothetical protein